jgi:hypothetical protein
MHISHLLEYEFTDSDGITYGNVYDYTKIKTKIRSCRDVTPNETPFQYNTFGPFGQKSLTAYFLHSRPIVTNFWYYDYDKTVSFSCGKMIMTNYDNHPDYIEFVCALKKALIIMYSQNPKAFQEFTENISYAVDLNLESDIFTEHVKSVYGDILDGVNGSYVLK